MKADLDRYAESLVAWAGIIRKTHIEKEDGLTVVQFYVEHRHFDWIEDYSIQREIYFLSPRGEGMFILTWPLPPQSGDDLPANKFVGDMLVVYGSPSIVRDGEVGFYPTEYVRLIPSFLFRDDILD